MFQNARRRCLLEQIATGAGAHGCEDPLVVVVDRQHQHGQLGIPLVEQRSTLNAGETGETDVDQHDVGQIAAHRIQGFLHGAKTQGAAVPLAAVDQKSQSFAKLALVLDDGHADGRRALLGPA